MDRIGCWRTGIIKCEEDKCFENILQRGSLEKKVICSGKLNTIKQTPLLSLILPQSKEDCLSFTYGYAIGVGREVDTYTVVRIFDEEYINVFNQAGIMIGKTSGSEHEFAIHGNIKTALTEHKSYRFLGSNQKYWLVRGLLASLCKGYYPGIYTKSNVIVDILSSLSCVCGFHVDRISVQRMGSEDFYYIKLINGSKDGKMWNLNKCTEIDTTHTLWYISCLDSEYFTLENGLVAPI